MLVTNWLRSVCILFYWKMLFLKNIHISSFITEFLTFLTALYKNLIYLKHYIMSDANICLLEQFLHQ